MFALACGCFATEARADGDPASDVLATQSLFLPQDAGIPFAQQGQLTGLVEAAARSGYPLRVAIIASSTDLGSVTALWHQPQTYARFLGQELSLVSRGPLLVVMPGGYGMSTDGAPDPAGASALAGLRAPKGGAALGTAALTAIERLAEASGHSVAVPAATATPSAGGTSDAIPLVVFALGAVLIAVAWTASLRTRPPQVGRRKASST
ncbi:MAG: hypothetical protein ACLP0L_17995 [Solirubrobacteraceae bacterium]